MGGCTHTINLQGGPVGDIEVGDCIPFRRSDGLDLKCEVVSKVDAAEGCTVVIWHDLPIIVGARDRVVEHEDGRVCTWVPHDSHLWRYGAPGGPPLATCYRDHFMAPEFLDVMR